MEGDSRGMGRETMAGEMGIGSGQSLYLKGTVYTGDREGQQNNIKHPFMYFLQKYPFVCTFKCSAEGPKYNLYKKIHTFAFKLKMYFLEFCSKVLTFYSGF